MKLTMYTATVPMMLRALDKLSALLDKAEAFAKEKNIDASVLLNSRLAPDQFPFVKQIQVAADNAKGCVGRLAGIEIPVFPNTETTVAELKERVQKTIDFLNTIKPEQIDGSEERMVEYPYAKGKVMTGYDYVTEHAIPNFFFHVTTAYSILRHNGVQIGKKDYIGPLSLKDSQAQTQ